MGKLQETEKAKPENAAELQVIQEGIKVVTALTAAAEEQHRKLIPFLVPKALKMFKVATNNKLKPKRPLGIQSWTLIANEIAHRNVGVLPKMLLQPTFAALQFELNVNLEKYFQLEFDTIFKNCVLKFCFQCS